MADGGPNIGAPPARPTAGARAGERLSMTSPQPRTPALNILLIGLIVVGVLLAVGLFFALTDNKGESHAPSRPDTSTSATTSAPTT